MSVFQKILGAVFAPYKFNVMQKAQNELFMAIISALPETFRQIKEQTLCGKLYDLRDWDLLPDFKSVVMGYAGDTVFQYKKRGVNFKIAGIEIFSKKNKRFENIEILVQNNLVCGIKITNSKSQIQNHNLMNLTRKK
ncbi:MAG: hypothetical protein FWG66_06325 [Spirochaetes bacterium]|nr:hypothetical protein [Spirochaetota bacterium]